MNKSDLIDFVSGKTELSKKDISKAVDAMFEGISEALKEGKEVTFVGFGTFKVSHRKARTGRNPRTGDVITIPETNIPKFKPGKILKETVNG